MKDLKRLAIQCEEELEAIGIRCGTVRSWSVNTRAKSRWGQCRQISPRVFDIDISERLLRDDVDEIAVKTTIIHELLHTVEGCLGHRGKWKDLAKSVGKEYPQYHIKRTSSCEEKGILQEEAPEGNTTGEDTIRKNMIQKNTMLQARYRITCMVCGARAYRQRAGRLVQRPEDFRCGRCGGRLKVEKRIL